MLTVALSKTLTAASANCIAQAQSIASGASAVLNGGSVVVIGNGVFGANTTQAVLDTQRRIQIVSSGNDTGKTAQIYGTRESGQPITEVLALTNGDTATSVLDYYSVNKITPSAATAANVTVGTGNTGSTDWVLPNYDVTPFTIQVITQLSGSVTYSVETTNDRNYFDPSRSPTGTTPQPNVNAVVSGTTVATTTALTGPVSGWRLTITAGQGTLTAREYPTCS